MEKQRWEESEKRRAEERRSEKRKSEKKEDARARKGSKVAKHCIFPMICGSGGLKSRLAKAAGAEPCGQMRDEKLHAVVARSTFPSQNVQTPQGRNAFGSCNVEKVHAVVARSTFPSQNVQSTPGSERFWKLWCRKSVGGCDAKHMSKSKCTKHTTLEALLEVEMSKKCTRLWREAHFEVKSVKNWRVRSTLGRSDVVSRGRRTGLCTLSEVSKTWGFSNISKNDGRRGMGHVKRTWKDAFSVAGAVQETCSSEMLGTVRRAGSWFPERGCVLEYQVFSFGKMILCDRCSTLYDVASLFRAGAILQRHGLEKLQNALVQGRQVCIQLSIIEGSLAELLRFWCCQLQ